MALCTIDTKTKTVEFSGAKNPMIYIKNGVVERIKGDKMPIGFSHYNESTFTRHQIPIDTPTCFYMFSDGYPDQFGGPEGRKFMVKQFQNLLVEIHDKPMETQKNILENTIDDWMRNEEQIDDILVIGFKLK